MISTLLALQAAGAAAVPPLDPVPVTAPRPTPVATDGIARIESVALFKNGLAWVRAAATLPGDEPVVLGSAPEPVHGTFWIRSETQVVARTTRAPAEVPFDGRWQDDPQVDLAGARVAIRLRSDGPTVTGRVAPAPKEPEQEFDSRYEQNGWGWWHRRRSLDYQQQHLRRSHIAVEDERGGTTHVPVSEIALLRILEPPPPRVELRPGLVLTAREGATEQNVEISYLTKGLSWAPSYRIDLGADGKLSLTQAAVVRNELAPLRDVELELVTGDPNTPLSHVLSPLAPEQSWRDFFDSVARRFSAQVDGMLTQVAPDASSSSSESGAAPPPEADEGVGLDHRSIGRHDLGLGDALKVEVETGTADYELVVEWTVPDEDAQSDRYQRYTASNPKDHSHEPWDALRFTNPLKRPMSTGPATITEGGRFLGERVVGWAAPGAEVVIPVTKALAITAEFTQFDVEKSREILVRRGARYVQNTVRGEIKVSNTRDRPVVMIVRRRILGLLAESDGEPVVRLEETSGSPIDPPRTVTWKISLAPREERTVRFDYVRLTRR
ncbi:MAG: DUF4139 domain-containing protein [Planctomycetota bacterium]